MARRRKAKNIGKGSRGLFEQAQDTFSRLRNLCLEIARSRGLEPDNNPVGKITLRVEIPLRNAWRFLPSDPGEDFLHQILSQIGRAQSKDRFFQQGRVFCFRCDSLKCTHCVPPASRTVFQGYSPTGTPLWQDFASLCLHRKDPRIEALYKDPPEALALTLRGRELKNEQLPIFGKNSKAYNILGETVFGFFPVLDPKSGERQYAAATLQAVLSSSRSGLSLRPNLLCFIPKMGDLNDLFTLGSDPHLHGLFSDLKERLHNLENQLPRRGRRETMEGELSRRVEVLLGQTGRKIERLFRQRRRRTRHAQDRLEQKARPGAKAFMDTMEAPPEKILYDILEKTYIVLGQRGRVHAFSPEGRHVTSVSFQQEEIKRRKEKGRWRETSLEARESLLAALKRERTE